MAHSMKASNLKAVRVVSLFINSSSVVNAQSLIVQAVNSVKTWITVFSVKLSFTQKKQSLNLVRLNNKTLRYIVLHVLTLTQDVGFAQLINA